MTESITLSADRPSTDPAKDLFGHAPFARTLAKAIQGYRGSDGIVLALYGPWGSGKSTVLAYVQHELELGAEESRPVIVSFNPWWFSGQESLAKTFLGQLQAVLPAKYEGFKALGNKLAGFADAIGGAADIASMAFGLPRGGAVIKAGAKSLASKPKDIPALKKDLSDLLLKEQKRVLVVIDDIDRLTPDEVRQLFTVIKALADFPYVTYLLAFDREVAATAISEQTGLPGERYLEKIIQVPFELPRPNRAALHRALFSKLDAVIAPTPEGRFDGMHWNNIFHSGLDPLITVPRDVIRLANVLSVTYPAVVGEVNPVDFIAIEALRVFLPGVYNAIRDSADQFVGHSRINSYDGAAGKQKARTFHDGWLTAVPEPLREPTKDMLQRLFPRLESVWSNMYYDENSAVEWRRALRVCSPEIFHAYFRLSLSRDAVSRSDIDALLAAAESPASFAKVLTLAAGARNEDGTSKVPALLERFMDYIDKDVSATATQSVIEALLDVGDQLLLPKDKDSSMFGFGTETRIGRIAYHLLKKADPTQRADLMLQALKEARALRCSEYIVAVLVDEAEKAARGEDEALISIEEGQSLKASWCERMKQLATVPGFIDLPSVALLVNSWHDWGDPVEAAAWWKAAATSDEGLLKLVAALGSEGRTQSGSDLAWRTYLRVDSRNVENYDDPSTVAERLRNLLDKDAVADQYQPAAKAFLHSYESRKTGKNPDS